MHAYVFRTANAGRPITLFIDDDVLMEVAGGGDLQAAVTSFETAVRSWLIQDGFRSGPFDKIYQEAKRWRSRWPTDSASPALPLLAASSLAASRMAKGEGIAQTNYYVHFFEIVNLPNTPRHQNEYGEAVPALWEDLGEWIDKIQGGRFGQSTIARHDWFTRICYALSQSLFRQSDRDRLPLFFKRMDVSAHAAVDAAELLPYFKRWAVTAQLSPGAKRMIAAKAYEEQLGAMLVQAASAWDGTERDEEGRRLGRLALAVEFVGPRGSLVLIGERPHGFPSAAEFTVASGAAWSLRSSGGGWYDESPIPLTPDALHNGLVLRLGAQFSLRLPADPVVPLVQSEELGRWVATSRLTLGVEHYLLTRNDLLPAVQDAIRSGGGGGGEVASTIVGVPTDYTLIRDVLVTRMPSPALRHELLPLSPVSNDRPVLCGGLVINAAGQRSYLCRGEPDVLIPDTATGIVSELLVDGARYPVPAGGGLVALSDLDLAGGAHRIVLGPSTLAFFSVQTFGRMVPVEAGTIGFRFGRASGGYRVWRVGAEALGPAGNVDEVAVSGASVMGSQSAVPDTPSPPVIVPRGRHSYFMIGQGIGDLEELHEPAVPAWLNSVGLYPTGFEHNPRFVVAWLLMQETHRWVARPVQPGSPTEKPQADRVSVRQWCRAVLSGMAARVDGDAALWLDYVVAAEDAAW